MRKLYLVGVAVVGILLAAGAVWVVVTQDREGPVITIDETQQITWQADMEKTKLLQGVTAVDDKDGDVTDTLIVESIKPQPTGDEAVVTYVAKDSSHNVTKATRKVTYSASDEDTYGGAEPQAEGQPEAADQTQEDAENGDTAQGQAAETDAAAQTPEELEQQAQAQRDAAIAALSPGAPRFYLKQHYVTISVGEEFNKLSWVEDITDDKDDRSRLFRDIRVEGDVNRNEPGTYELAYYAADSDGNRSNREILTVTVN